MRLRVWSAAGEGNPAGTDQPHNSRRSGASASGIGAASDKVAAGMET